MLTKKTAQIVNHFTLNGTIDGHDPIGVTWRIKGNDGWFRLTVISVNWGRGYKPGEFKQNVMRVLNVAGEREYVVLLIQELDEADSAPERKILIDEMESGTTLVPKTPCRETIAVSPGVKVIRPRKVMTMDQGTKIGAPTGTGPRRFFISCIAVIEGVRIALGDQHPHRVDPDWSPHAKQVVNKARSRGVKITAHQVDALVEISDMAVYGGDMNDPDYPYVNPHEQVAFTHGLDTIRWVLG